MITGGARGRGHVKVRLHKIYRLGPRPDTSKLGRSGRHRAGITACDGLGTGRRWPMDKGRAATSGSGCGWGGRLTSGFLIHHRAVPSHRLHDHLGREDAGYGRCAASNMIGQPRSSSPATLSCRIFAAATTNLESTPAPHSGWPPRSRNSPKRSDTPPGRAQPRPTISQRNGAPRDMREEQSPRQQGHTDTAPRTRRRQLSVSGSGDYGRDRLGRCIVVLGLCRLSGQRRPPTCRRAGPVSATLPACTGAYAALRAGAVHRRVRAPRCRGRTSRGAPRGPAGRVHRAVWARPRTGSSQHPGETSASNSCPRVLRRSPGRTRRVHAPCSGAVRRFRAGHVSRIRRRRNFHGGAASAAPQFDQAAEQVQPEGVRPSADE
jgi:hypothetical protein